MAIPIQIPLLPRVGILERYAVNGTLRPKKLMKVIIVLTHTSPAFVFINIFHSIYISLIINFEYIF